MHVKLENAYSNSAWVVNTKWDKSNKYKYLLFSLLLMQLL